jgi:hypothetical protein
MFSLFNTCQNDIKQCFRIQVQTINKYKSKWQHKLKENSLNLGNNLNSNKQSA